MVRFHPVGQGLFSSGKVYCKNGDEFKFVYDCGTSSKQGLLDDAISSLSVNGDINLLTISHFDQDHISGLVRLLNKHRVKILLLPYLSLEERLYIAYSNNIGVSDSFMNFYLDPIKYLMSKCNNNIEQIILVPSGKKEVENDYLSNDDDLYIDINHNHQGVHNHNVKVLKVGGRIIYRKLFEFIPYNDSCLSFKSTKSFRNIIKKERECLLNSLNVNCIQASLGRIRDSYDKNFGKSPFKRNVISLFLFAGPCLKNNYGVGMINNNGVREIRHFYNDKNGILYTGDAHLDNKNKLQELINFMGRDRISRIGCFQVMHHGARGCWYSGIAKELSPYISVFSSDPERSNLKHPHAEVVKDFLPFNPVQVDKERFINIYFYSW